MASRVRCAEAIALANASRPRAYCSGSTLGLGGWRSISSRRRINSARSLSAFALASRRSSASCCETGSVTGSNCSRGTKRAKGGPAASLVPSFDSRDEASIFEQRDDLVDAAVDRGRIGSQCQVRRFGWFERGGDAGELGDLPLFGQRVDAVRIPPLADVER